MCIIAVKPAAKAMFSNEELKTMFENNPNGAGLMYRTKSGKVHIEKGFMEIDSLLEYVNKHVDVLNDTDVVFHFRISTSGKTDMLTCHPYPVWSYNRKVSTDVELAMAHNGMLDSYGWKGDSNINDTQVFIRDCLRKLPHNFLKNKGTKSLIKKAIGSNKLCFLNKDGFVTFGDFVKDNGYLYSNTSYQKRESFFSSSFLRKSSSSNSKSVSLFDDYFPDYEPKVEITEEEDLTDYVNQDYPPIEVSSSDVDTIKEMFSKIDDLNLDIKDLDYYVRAGYLYESYDMDGNKYFVYDNSAVRYEINKETKKVTKDILDQDYYDYLHAGMGTY